MVKRNVVRNYTDMDDRGADLYNALVSGDLPTASFDIARLFYLYFLQTLTDPRAPSQNYFFNGPSVLQASLGKRGHAWLENPEESVANINEKTIYVSGKASFNQPKLEWGNLFWDYPYLYLSSEYIYEYLRGTRMADPVTLEQCEANLTEFEGQFNKAVVLFRQGIADKNFTTQREGVFEVADSFMLITNVTWQCYQVELLIEATIKLIVKPNVANPIMILVNCGTQSFYIASALLAQFANFTYADWFSFSYWLGDLTYRFLVVDSSKYFL